MNMIFDGHLDLAMNALEYRRDLTQTVATLRELEAQEQRHTDEQPTVSLPAMRDGDVHFCVSTIFTRCRRAAVEAEAKGRIPAFDYASTTQAFAAGQAQIAWHQQLQRQNAIRVIKDADTLLDHARDRADHRLGCILMIEGADPIVQPAQLSLWAEQGVRVVALVHSGANIYAHGNGQDGPLTDAGKALLDEMATHRVVLDVSHLSDRSFRQAMDHFKGKVVATHSNCRSLVPGDRQLTDEQMREIIERDGVIGMVAFNCFLDASWKMKDTTQQRVSLERMAEHIDHVCQLTGDARHVGIGSDLDGGFGVSDVPGEIDTIADMWKLAGHLRHRGYEHDAIKSIFHANWIRVYHEAMS